MKVRVNWTIDKNILEDLEAYQKEREKTFGSISKSIIVEGALAREIPRLRRELRDFRGGTKALRDASVDIGH